MKFYSSIKIMIRQYIGQCYTGKVLAVAFLCLAAGHLASANAQGVSFSYQGKLTDSSIAANGTYEMQFSLFDAAAGGSQTGSTLTIPSIAVTDGIFTVSLNFGANAFSGSPRFLEIGVRAQGSASPFTILAPRQALVSAPYAIRSLSAGTADSATTAATANTANTAAFATSAGSAATANDSNQLGGIPSGQFVQTNDTRLTDARTPTAGSASYIQNSTNQQSAANFNVSGTGSANILNAASQYNIGGNRLLAVDGNANIFFGLNTTTSNTGINNSFVGNGAGQANTNGIRNTFLGAFAGNKNNTGSFGTFVGEKAGFANTQGTANSFFGYNSGNSNTNGNSNSFFGSSVGAANTTGRDNSFFGANAGGNNTTGIQNSFFGSLAGSLNSTGTNNSYFGNWAGQATKGEQNSFFGAFAGSSAFNSASDNSFFGTTAGAGNTSGTENAFFGIHSGNYNTTGNGNAFFGALSGYSNIDGFFNTYVGQRSGQGNTSGSYNSFFGRFSGYQNSTGNLNTFIGLDAGRNNTTGSFNAFFGEAAGETNTTGQTLTIIGGQADVLSTNLDNATALGFRAFVSQSNSLVLGGITGVKNGANTNVGIGTTAPQARFHIKDNNGNIMFGNGGCNAGFAGVGFAATLTCSNYSLLGDGSDTIINRPSTGDISFRENNVEQVKISSGGKVSITTLGSAGSTQLCRNASNQISTCSSSLRYKKNIDKFTSGLNVVTQLKPITFDWKEDGMHDLGLGAEDVAKVNDLLVIRNNKGEVEGVKYDRISVVLVNAVKEQQDLIEQQKNLLNRLEKRLVKVELENRVLAAKIRRKK